jgi:hypothetical protein
MSDKKHSAAYNPAKEPAYTLSEIQEAMKVYAAIRKFTESPWISRAIYAAGIGAVAEIIHFGWLAARYIWKF